MSGKRREETQDSAEFWLSKAEKVKKNRGSTVGNALWRLRKL